MLVFSSVLLQLFLLPFQIDCTVIPLMDDSLLSRYVPLLGDRIALKEFCKRNETSKTKNSRKESLLSNLRRKLYLRRGSESDDSSDSSKKKDKHVYGLENKNALKNTRKIEIGWMSIDTLTNKQKQVRKKKGGGTRKLDIRKDATKEDIMELGKRVFFPGGISPLGPATEFDFQVRDFTEEVIAHSDTVGNMYKNTGMNILRFYLSTVPKGYLPDLADMEREEGDSDAVIVNPPENLPSEIFEQKEESMDTASNNMPRPSTSSSELRNEKISNNSSRPIASGSRPTLRSETVTNNTATGASNLRKPDHHSEGMTIDDHKCIDRQLSHTDTSNVDDDETPPLSSVASDSDEDIRFRPFATSTMLHDNDDTIPFFSSLEMTIHRGMALKEILHYFKDPHILDKVITIVRILPNGEKELGEDTGGVFRDVIAEFWADFYDTCTLGRNTKVPCLRHDYGVEEWRAVSRFMIYGLQKEGYWPIQLGQILFSHGVMGKPVMDLKSSFFDYVSESDKETLEEAFDNFTSVDMEDLLEVLDSYGCRSVVSAQNVKMIILEIAHKELIQAPNFVTDCWKEVFKEVQYKGLLDTDRLNQLYETLIPKTKQVVSMMKFQEDKAEHETAKHLKRYVKNMDAQKLRKFLRFVTGSDLVVCREINVTFASMHGISRRPIAHTCSCTLELADQFQSFMDFRKEFDSVLSSDVWVMDIV